MLQSVVIALEDFEKRTYIKQQQRKEEHEANVVDHNIRYSVSRSSIDDILASVIMEERQMRSNTLSDHSVAAAAAADVRSRSTAQQLVDRLIQEEQGRMATVMNEV